MDTFKHFIRILLLVVSCSGLMAQQLEQMKDDLWMVIFVHGTSGAMSNASFSNIYHIMIDEVENTPYETAVELIRTNPYMYQNQPMYEYGLHQLDCTHRQPGKAADLFAHAYDLALQDSFPKWHGTRYYTYGWSGVLSETIRYKNASRFYNELWLEHRKVSLENPQKRVRICVVAYSHGGTVALQLAHVFEREHKDEPLAVDMLALLGSPIQSETAYLVTNPIFKQVYLIYSRCDRVQLMDFFSFKRFFSKRRFSDASTCPLPAHITQIELKLMSERRQYKPGEKPRYSDRSPGHIELWFFGWTEGMYRKHFPLNPLPAACLIPALIRAAQDGMPGENDVVIQLYATAEKCIVKKRTFFKKVQTRGISRATLERMKKVSCSERPPEFNRPEYIQHMHSAIKQAYGTLSEKHAKNKCQCGS